MTQIQSSYVTQEQTQFRTVYLMGRSGWQLDDLTSGGSVGTNSVSVAFNHSANAAIIVLVISSNSLPSSLTVTSEISLTLESSYNGAGAGAPSLALYAGSAATANLARNITANFASNQGTCLIIAMSWLFPGHTIFTFNNPATGSAWSQTAGLQVTMSSDLNANRLALFFASVYTIGGQLQGTNGAGLTTIQTLGNYQSSPANSISAQVAYVVSNSALAETMNGPTGQSTGGILYPFIGVDPA